MARTSLIVLFAGFAVVSAAHSSVTEDLFNSDISNPRFSDNVFEDAKLDVPELVRKYRYPLEEHEVTTSDGYILRMHRIPHGRDQNNTPGVKRPVVFLMHGLLCSSADWVIMGPGNGFAYILAESGFDVWMGNARGNYYSRRHVRLNPNSILSNAFWEFSWDEIGNIDLPTMIDYTLKYTGQEKLHYIGHSQGTTSFFVMASLRPEYNNKIISMHAFAPVAYMAHNKSLLLNTLARYVDDIEEFASRFGIGEFMPNSQIMTWAGESMCRDEVATQAICSNILFLIGGWNEDQHNATMMPAIFGHTPAGAAVRQFAHYGQSIAGKEFRRYDHGLLRNMIVYGNMRPPKYNLGNVKIPTFLHYSYNDPLSQVKDVYRLHEELGHGIKMLLPLPTFSHLDYMWGIDAKTVLYDRVINLMKSVGHG
ncbi:Lipase 3 [Papilio machaon]|uniref:Lipase n=1 Tax=Papilio machaon TaxID=76193 RepID=A0A194QQB7_PAPMA|nr:Lipase 3 [Papilio machaon]